MILAVTGHRPKKLGGHSRELDNALNGFARHTLARLRPSGVITGMALGWDQAVAVACVWLRIPFVAAIPFEGQESRWPVLAQKNYRHLLTAASHVIVVTRKEQFNETEWESVQPPVAWAMQHRNQWMVDNSTALLALWNGDRHGGTFNCIQYAREGCREIVNVWDEWIEWWDSGSYLI